MNTSNPTLTHNYTHRNHFVFGYNDGAYNSRSSADDVWSVSYGTVTKDVGTFRSECYRAAQLVENLALTGSLPISVMFSGGSESEMMLRSFTEQSIPVEVHIMQFEDNINRHDIQDAFDFCESQGITPIKHTLNILDFWRGPAYDYAERTKCVSPQLLSTMWLMDQIDGLPVLGSAECYIAYEDLSRYQYYDHMTNKLVQNEILEYPKKPWYLHEREKIAAWYRHPMLDDRPAVPGFFQYTPELMLSFLQHPWTQRLARCEEWGKLSNASTKKIIYEEAFPGLRQKKKTTGFEHIMEHDAVIRAELYRTYGQYSAEYRWEYNSLVKHLKGETNE